MFLLLLYVGLCGLPAPAMAKTVRAVRVTINSSPPSATVFVDGKERGLQGYASPSFKLRLTKGPHRLLLELSGYKPLEQLIDVQQTQQFTFTLERAQAKLEVRPTGTDDSARGADVFVDGTAAGTVPAQVEVTPGKHLVEVRKAGFKVYSETVDTSGPETRPLLVALQPVPPPVKESPPPPPPPPPPAKTRSLLVVTSIPEAEVIVDGTTRVRANQRVTDLTAGQHVINVQAKGYKPSSVVVEVEAGKQRVENVELQQSAEGRGVGTARIIMVNPVEGAQYYVNGRPYDQATLLSDKGIELSSGQNIIVVRKEGYAEVRKDLFLTAGGTETVSIELREAAPPSAQVAQEVAPPVPQQVLLAPPPLAAPFVVMAAPRPYGASSFSALTNRPGHFTVDIGTGYPYLVDLRLQIGAVALGMFGLDAGLELRSTIYETDVNAVLRAQLFRTRAVAGGVNLLIGGGGGPRQRNGFVFEAGLPFTLLAGSRVHLTVRPYLQVYSDRLCPSAEYIVDLANRGQSGTLMDLAAGEHAGDRCVGGGDENMPAGYPNAIVDASRSLYRSGQAAYQSDGTGVLERFVGARFLLQAALEVEVNRFTNLWLLIEGAPGQGERSSSTDKFNRLFPLHDVPVYGRAGVTVKF